MKILFCYLTILLLVSEACKKPGCDCFPNVQIHYIDNGGKDLFTNGLNGYYKDSVNVFDYQNGIKTPLPISSQSAYFAGWSSSTIVIDGSINNNVINRYTNNIIHLKTGIDDTLKIHLTSEKQFGSKYDSIWYNGVLKSDTFTIVK